VDTVVHLAGIPGGEDFDRLVNLNFRGTYHVLEAAAQNGVRQVVYASSCCASLGWGERADVYTTADLPMRPNSLYGASKGYGEQLGWIYADHHDLPVICLRIGHCTKAADDRPQGLSDLFCWISNRDMAQITSRCIENDDIHFAVFYATSHAPKACLDIEPAKQVLGYRPQDSVEPFMASYDEDTLRRYRQLQCRRLDRSQYLAILRYQDFGVQYW
jgi:uronate dehydrogenase